MNNDWTVVMPRGAICRSIVWRGKEVAYVNPAGDFDEETEKDLAAGIAHAGKMHALLRKIGALPRTQPLSDSLQGELTDLLTSIETIDVGRYVEVEE